MFLDTTRFPFVYLRNDAHPEESTEVQIVALLDRQERFVLVTDHLPSPDHDHDESHEERKQRALFFKRNKPRIRQFCAGGIIVAGDKTVPAYVRLPAQAIGKAFGFELTFVRDEYEALTQGRKLLQQPLSQ